jgi:hypothetical protein
MIRLCDIKELKHAKPFYFLDDNGFIVEEDEGLMEKQICLLDGFEDVAEYLYIKSNGQIVSRHAGNKVLKTQFDNDGYERIRLSTNTKKRKSARVHRLVALAFVENPDPENYTTVDHIDRNTRNNIASNLRWADARIQALNSSRSKAVVQMLEDGFVIKIWYSLTELASAFGEDDATEVKKALKTGELYHGFKLGYAKDVTGADIV